MSHEAATAVLRRLPLSDAQREGLRPRLAQALADASAQWPDVEVDPEAFATAVARHLAEDGDLPASLGALDVRQQLMARFFVGTEGSPPRIDSYSGLGSLRAWVKVASTRLRIDLQRKRGDKDDRLETRRERNLLAAAVDDPELDFLKRHYRGEFKEAFAEALAALEPRQRNVLRLAVCERLSATKIAELYEVNRATAKRWLAAARAELFAATRAALSRRLQLDPAEFESIVRLIDTHFDISVQRLLR